MASFTGIVSQVETARSSRGPAMYVLDRLLAAPLLLLAAPFIGLAAFITWRLSRQSPFVAHRRVGQHGEPFWMLKLRTMWEVSPESKQMQWVELVSEQPVSLGKAASDDRVTSRFARFCRRYSIDELPQLWHVMQGRMALVGPRPITRLELTTHYAGAAAEVLHLRPGLSGLWQVMGRSRLSYRERRRLDLFLVRHFSAGLYFYILWRSVFCAIQGTNAW